MPEDIERLIYLGELKRASKVINQRLKDTKVPQCLKRRLELELRLMEALPETYTLTENKVFDRLSKEVKGFTAEEFEELKDDGTLDWIMLEGEVRFMGNCCESFLKTRTDYSHRLTDESSIKEKQQNFAMLNAIIDKMKSQGHVHLRYKVRETLRILPHAECPGETIKVYLPLPVKDKQSIPINDIITAPEASHIAPEDASQRTAYFEAKYQKGMTFSAEFIYEIDAPYLRPEPDMVAKEQPSFFTEEMLPQIRFTPYIRALAAELKGDETNPLIIARRFYDYCTTNACYRFVPPYMNKTCIPEYFGAGLRGDCGMHALLFITLCRVVGIPAVWQSGWYARPDSISNHDWACFYVEPYGWLFADASFGGAAYREGDFERWNFYFGNLEPWRMVASSDLQQDFEPPYPFLRDEPYDNQWGEVAYESHPLRSWDYEIQREIISCEEIM